MEAVELARHVAADLHAQAVSKGRDPWRPYEFAVAEARRRDVDVETARPGAKVLNGGRATYVASDSLIIHENVGTDFEKAFLVAHEIGHIELGHNFDDEGAACEFDAARSAEPSWTATERVVDYGRRQRREVQMDLFAREFLLPRAVARRLHIDETMTATAIAERMGARFEVVAQQLFDALLLPPVEATPDPVHGDRTLHPLQAEAARHAGRRYLLEAGPGTGKTQTLTARVERILADDVDPRRILLLTFSNRAAAEMASRIARKDKRAAAAMWIGTFHAFGLDVIRRFHSELTLAEEPRLLDRAEAVELLEREFPRLGLVHYRNLYDPTQIISDMLTAISYAKDEVVDEKRYAELADRMLWNASTPEAVADAERRLEVARVYEAYERLKRLARGVDFGDLVALPVRLLEGDEAIRTHLQRQYDHILVDEYQDVNRSSVRLLEALCGDRSSLWVVGDAKQSIYRFRGASSYNMARFGASDFAGGSRGRLKRNYRSVSEIVAAYSGFAVGMKAGDAESGLEAEREVGGNAAEVRLTDRSEHQTVAVADAIEEMRRAGYRYRDQAVLCTGNEKLASLGKDLERLGIPVLFLGSLFERSEVRDLLALLSILVDRRAMGLVRVACWPEFSMAMPDVAAVIDHLRENDSKAGEWRVDLEAIRDVSDAGRGALARLSAAIDDFDAASSPWRMLATLLLDRTRIGARLAASESVADRSGSIAVWQFLNFVSTQPTGHGAPVTRLLDRVRRLVRLGDERDLRQLPAAAQGLDAVRLMTIHGAKGLEFPVVHLPGMSADTLPRTPPSPPCPPPDGMIEGGTGPGLAVLRAAHDEEQECLFYVALSRARDRLVVYAPTQKANGHSRPVSPYLNRLGGAVTRGHVVASRELPPTPEAATIPLEFEGRLAFAASEIALHESCPRRFFYTHILQVGGRRAATPFMQMHEAVRTVFQAVIAGDAAVADDEGLASRIADACTEHGLVDHGYLADYHGLALSMVRFFLSTREGHTPESSEALRLVIGDEEIIVRPDDVLVRPDGERTLRRVHTGHYRSSEMKDVAAAAFVLAARQAFPDAVVELVHLSDQAVRPVNLSAKELDNRRDKLGGYLADIRAGRFPASPSPRVCPGCPAFFICGPTPPGSLAKKF